MTSEDRDPDQGSRSSRVRGKKRKQLPVWQETILLFATALVLAIVLKAFFVQAFWIPSESMEPGLVEDDRILVQKPSYWFGEPERGDVVVFEDAHNWLPAAEEPSGVTSVLAKIGLYPTGGHLVKRVIGVAGDTITCCDDEGRISVNGHPLDESEYAVVDEDECYGPMPDGTAYCDWEVGPVPDGHLFVMGDNRSHSADSSFHACFLTPANRCEEEPYVDVDDVVGKVFVLLWPTDRFGFLHRPDAFDDVPDAP
ncbi:MULTISPECIES: signal peptidase I [unclassified Nocardioides]|uniref:signal peptidase I n=1 Tax=unclassified Nocardioides TaxID=2615069 RepID=UPI00360C1AB4